ncbi:ATP-binding cassette domain-containing protein [Gammaproteobacteria bacterium]
MSNRLMDTIPVLELIDVVSHADGRVLIDGVSLSVVPGSLLAVTGLAGSGKSALLNLLSTLVRPNSGRVRLFGKDTEAIGEEGRRALRLDIGVVFEEGGLLDGFTVSENIELPLARRGVRPPELNRRAEQWLNQLQLSEYRDFVPHQLSMRLTRRVALARALATEPRLLICDEVTTGLDLQTVLTFNRLFNQLRTQQGTTIVLASSDLPEIARIADTIAVLHGGRLAFHGDLHLLTAQRLQDPILKEIFDDESWFTVFPSSRPP